MSLQEVPVGDNVPDDVNAIIEIPMNSPAIKYQVDKTGVERYNGSPDRLNF